MNVLNKCSMAEHSDLSSVLNDFKISEADSKLQISDYHLQKISRSYCEDWRKLPIFLGIEAIVVKDIDRENKSEYEKRSSFFEIWKKMRGRQATYRSLINGLLEIKSRIDAESVCRLLKDCGMYIN
jgi:hypothetical protein